MRRLALIPLILFGAQAAWAQAYPDVYAQQTTPAPQTTYPQPSQPAGNVYAGQPTYAPQPQPSYAPAPANPPHPGDAGQSVMTDIRQMNF